MVSKQQQEDLTFGDMFPEAECFALLHGSLCCPKFCHDAE
jgi:hypothetical protein